MSAISNTFTNYSIRDYQQAKVVFQSVEAGDKLRWEQNLEGKLIPVIDKKGFGQNLRRTFSYYCSGNDFAAGVKASEVTLEFISSFDIQDQIVRDKDNAEHKMTRYKIITISNACFFESLKHAFDNLANTYSTENSSWRKDSDVEARQNYEEASRQIQNILNYLKKEASCSALSSSNSSELSPEASPDSERDLPSPKVKCLFSQQQVGSSSSSSSSTSSELQFQMDD